MELRVGASRMEQLLQQKAAAIAQRDAEILRLREARPSPAQQLTSSLHAARPILDRAADMDGSNGAAAGAAAAAHEKETARLRAALAASEGQRSRDNHARERELAALHRAHAKQLAALQHAAAAHAPPGQALLHAGVPGTRGPHPASGGPRTPESDPAARPVGSLCSKSPSEVALQPSWQSPCATTDAARRSSAVHEQEAERVRGRLARLNEEYAAVAAGKLAAEAAAAAALADAEQLWRSAEGDARRMAELQAELRSWRSRCEAMQQHVGAGGDGAELLWGHAQKPNALFPLQDYVSPTMLKGAQLAGTPHWQYAAAAAYACNWGPHAVLQPQQDQGQAPCTDQLRLGDGWHKDRQREVSCGAGCAAGEAARHRSWQSDAGSSLFSVEWPRAREPGVGDAPGSMELDALLQTLEATELELPAHKLARRQDAAGPPGQQSPQPQQLLVEDAPAVTLAAPEGPGVPRPPPSGALVSADAAARQRGDAAAQALGAVRSDIVAALQRRGALLVCSC